MCILKRKTNILDNIAYDPCWDLNTDTDKFTTKPSILFNIVLLETQGVFAFFFSLNEIYTTENKT